MGGLGKGHLIREIDAMGGVMGLASDLSGIQFRMLNRTRGEAVQGPRAQIDRNNYKSNISNIISSERIDIIEDEVINILTKDNCLNPENNANWFPGTGDYSSFGTVGNGTAEVSLLNSSDDWATACTNSAKILWTTTLTTPYVVTADSTFQLNMKTTDSVSVDFDSDSGNNNIMKMGADPVQLYLTVTE